MSMFKGRMEYLQIALMHVYVTQANFTTKPRFEIKNKRSFTEMNSQGSRVEKNTHAKKVQIQKFCSQTRLVGEIYSSDVIMHRGYSMLGTMDTDAALSRLSSLLSLISLSLLPSHA